MKLNAPGSSVFNTSTSVNCRGRLLDLATPAVTGILNVTPDSFYDGGKFTEEKAIISRVSEMLADGAAVIDIGGHSTRPGAADIEPGEELKRVLPVVSLLCKNFPGILVSVDTFRASVAEACINEGASIINDISGGDFDPGMFDLVARLRVPYIIMHIKGTPADMQYDPQYEDVVNDVLVSLGNKVHALRKKGVADVIIDPGFGFGKTTGHNYSLLKNLEVFKALGCPVMAGLSRKSMICKVLKINPEKALNGTTALHMAALMNGASLLRVHDVKEAVEVVQLFKAYSSAG